MVGVSVSPFTEFQEEHKTFRLCFVLILPVPIKGFILTRIKDLFLHTMVMLSISPLCLSVLDEWVGVALRDEC